MLRPACPGPAAPRSRSATAEGACGERGAALSQPAPRPPPHGGAERRNAGERPASSAPTPRTMPALLPKVLVAGESWGPQTRTARASSRPSCRQGPRANARPPSHHRLHAARGTCPRPSARPRPARLASQVLGAAECGAPQPCMARAHSSRSLGSLLAAPESRPRRRVRIRNFTSAEGKRERKVCAVPAGEPKRRMRRATRLLLAGASCLSAGLPAPCPARPQLSQPEPWPGCRRRLFRPSDDPAARLPQLPPRSQRCPARARGSHTLTLAGAHSHTRTHAPEGSAAAAAATTTRAESGGRRGARGRGAGPPGGAPANNVG